MRTLLPHSAVIAGLLPLLFAACSTSPAGASALRTAADGESFALAAGESIALSGRGTLRYVRLVKDSRCRPDVQCVWAGDAEVEFEWTATGGKPEGFSLHTGLGDRSRDLDGSLLTLVELARGENPEARLRIEAAGR